MKFLLVHLDGMFAIFVSKDMDVAKVTFSPEVDISFLQEGEWYILKDILE